MLQRNGDADRGNKYLLARLPVQAARLRCCRQSEKDRQGRFMLDHGCMGQLHLRGDADVARRTRVELVETVFRCRRKTSDGDEQKDNQQSDPDPSRD